VNKTAAEAKIENFQMLNYGKAARRLRRGLLTLEGFNKACDIIEQMTANFRSAVNGINDDVALRTFILSMEFFQ